MQNQTSATTQKDNYKMVDHQVAFTEYGIEIKAMKVSLAPDVYNADWITIKTIPWSSRYINEVTRGLIGANKQFVLETMFTKEELASALMELPQ